MPDNYVQRMMALDGVVKKAMVAISRIVSDLHGRKLGESEADSFTFTKDEVEMMINPLVDALAFMGQASLGINLKRVGQASVCYNDEIMTGQVELSTASV